MDEITAIVFYSPSDIKKRDIAIHYSKTNWRVFHLIDSYSIDTKYKGPKVTANHKGDSNRVIFLDDKGKLTIPKRFEWNGPTGAPNIDYLMRGSCVHDALYEIFDSKNHKELRNKLKPIADDLLYDLVRADGASVPVAWAVYAAVRFGSPLVED